MLHTVHDLCIFLVYILPLHDFDGATVLYELAVWVVAQWHLPDPPISSGLAATITAPSPSLREWTRARLHTKRERALSTSPTGEDTLCGATARCLREIELVMDLCLEILQTHAIDKVYQSIHALVTETPQTLGEFFHTRVVAANPAARSLLTAYLGVARDGGTDGAVVASAASAASSSMSTPSSTSRAAFWMNASPRLREVSTQQRMLSSSGYSSSTVLAESGGGVSFVAADASAGDTALTRDDSMQDGGLLEMVHWLTEQRAHLLSAWRKRRDAGTQLEWRGGALFTLPSALARLQCAYASLIPPPHQVCLPARYKVLASTRQRDLEMRAKLYGATRALKSSGVTGGSSLSRKGRPPGLAEWSLAHVWRLFLCLPPTANPAPTLFVAQPLLATLRLITASANTTQPLSDLKDDITVKIAPDPAMRQLLTEIGEWRNEERKCGAAYFARVATVLDCVDLDGVLCDLDRRFPSLQILSQWAQCEQKRKAGVVGWFKTWRKKGDRGSNM
jgi:hypothetical protein